MSQYERVKITYLRDRVTINGFTKRACIEQAKYCSKENPNLIFEIREVENTGFVCDIPEHFARTTKAHGMWIGNRIAIYVNGMVVKLDDIFYRYYSAKFRNFIFELDEEVRHFNQCKNTLWTGTH